MVPKLPTLKFQSIRESLVGREEQQAVLTEALTTVLKHVQQPGQEQSSSYQGPQVVCLEGASGSGKTHLVDCWFAGEKKKQENNGQKLVLAKGKVDQNQSTSYSALIEAVSGLIAQIPQRDKLRAYLMCDLEESELKLLSDFIPSIRTLLQDDTSSKKRRTLLRTYSDDTVSTSGNSQEFGSSSSSFSTSFRMGDNVGFRNPLERFNFVFGEFLVTLSQLLPPCVFFLDDVQWADSSTVQLLQHMVANQKLSQMMLVLAARPDEVLEQNVYPDLSMTVEGTGRVWRRLKLGELDLSSCNQIVSQLTQQGIEDCEELTKVCYAKTKGNPYFFLRFLESLERRQLIFYSMTQFQFAWDITQLKAQTDLADNVATIVAEGIQALEAPVQQTVRIASRLGFSFGVRDLAFVLEKGVQDDHSCEPSSGNRHSFTSTHGGVSDSVLKSVQNHLQVAVDARLIDDQGDGRFKFSHDQILQSFLAMTSAIEHKEKEDLKLGQILLSLFRMDRKANEWALFAGLKALRPCHANLPPKFQTSLIVDNCLAAKMAFKKSAFYEATQFSWAALELLRSITTDPWKENGKLCRKLHLLTAQYELACGRHIECKVVIESLLENSPEFEQKVDAYFILACSLRNQSKIAESTVLLRQALREMDENIPDKPNQRQFPIGFTPSKFKNEFIKLSEADLLEASPIVRRQDQDKMKFMSILFLNSYYQHEHNKTWFVLQRMLSLTKELGVCEYTPLVVAAYAYHLANKGEFTEGSRYGEIATQLVAKLGSVNLPIVTFFLVVFVNHLRKPMFKSLPDLKHGFQVGMEEGDSQAAFLCATTDVCYQFMVANHLKENAESCANYFRLAHEYGQTNLKKEILLMWQLSSNLLGASADPTQFDGAVMNECELMNEITMVDKTNYFRYLQSICYIYLGCWEQASDVLRVVLNYDNCARLLTSHYSTCFSTIYGAITWYKVLAKKRDKKLMAKAGKAMAAIKNRVKNGAINLAPGLWFIEAQKAAIDKPMQVVKKTFDQAIVGLHRCGLRNLEALACQCFAEFALEKGDLEHASDYMKRAYEAYVGWGAGAVVSSLESKHGSLLLKK